MLRQMLKKQKKNLHKICIKHEITEQFWSATLTFLFLYFYKNSSCSTSKIKTFINSIAEPNALWWGIWRWQGHSRTLNISRSSWQRLMIQELLEFWINALYLLFNSIRSAGEMDTGMNTTWMQGTFEKRWVLFPLTLLMLFRNERVTQYDRLIGRQHNYNLLNGWMARTWSSTLQQMDVWSKFTAI